MIKEKKVMHLDHSAMDEMFLMVMTHGVEHMIREGIKCGAIMTEREGVVYLRSIIDGFEVLEMYEKCQVLNNMLVSYDTSKAA